MEGVFINMINKLRFLLRKRDKQYLLGLLFFSIFISIIEAVGISVIMPFIAVATDFKLIHSNEYYSLVYEFFSFDSDIKFVIVFGIVLIFFYMFRSGVNLIYFYVLSKFTQGRYYVLTYRLFENYMGLPYKEFINRNTSTLTKSIVSEANNLVNLIQSVLYVMSEIFVVIFIYLMMLYVDYKITLLITIILAVNSIVMLKTVSVNIKKAGKIKAEMQKRYFEIINRSFANFKLIKLNSNNNQILTEFSHSSYDYAQANVKNTTLINVPRLFLEAIGFSLIISIIVYLVYKTGNNISSVLPIISMFILALYRLMPSVNRIMNSYNQILFNYKSLEIIHHDLMSGYENLGFEAIKYNKNIILNNICFEYKKNKSILNNINLVINKGDSIGLIGKSGSGKSTLVDLIMGLYKPEKGSLIIDGIKIDGNNVKSWRSQIGYIPQNIYLFDGTVLDNVIFGRELNNQKLIKVLMQSNIYDFLKTKEGLYTKVGEGGIQFSGGQKQRIAIARALYGDPEILVLDEATSALDNDTESLIMNEIYDISKDKTLIIIAHRLGTIEKCDKIYEMSDGLMNKC